MIPAFIKKIPALLLAAIAVLAIAPPGLPARNVSKVYLGILANKGKPAAVESWQPLVDYLGQAVPGHEFILRPLDFDELYPEVEAGNLDFVITNTGQYIELESAYGISRIATFRNAGPSGFYTRFGGVLFVRRERGDILTIDDFPGKRILVADEKSFGGWLMQLREIKDRGIDPGQFAAFESIGNHETVVFSVLDGEFDIGAIRSDVLERLIEEGKVDPCSIRLINERREPGFPFRHSTRLYPEWPFAKAAHTDSLLARAVAVALLTMPEDSPAARAARSGGWTIPENYNPAHELFRELRLGPYQHTGEFMLADVIKRYWPVILLSTLLLIVAAGATIWINMINRRLETALSDMNRSHTRLEKTNTLLVESMQYARIIQESLLPDRQVLAEIVAELAVLWKPLNLVGGDYYSMGPIDGKACIIVADCTGHGVPGALVTMALSASLDFIFHEEKLTDPGRILTEIDRNVRKRLRQDQPESTTDDGLEAAVCIYDPVTGALDFSGAGLPLLWVKSGNTGFVKGDRSSLGYRTWRPKGPFKNHRLIVEPGMTFYLFTDGITNQIGGRPERLFGRKRLADLLTGLERQPLDRQIPAIEEHLQSYRRNEEPRDDMTLIGFRFK